MASIRQIIARRTDLSTFLVHLTREYEGSEPFANLTAILRDGGIEARTPMGSAVKALRRANRPEEDLVSQRCVCFTETPLEHISLLLDNIDDLDRDCLFAPFGVAISKRVGREQGVNPVWYTDITPGHDWLIQNVDALFQHELQGPNRQPFGDTNIGRLTPFIEQMGAGQRAGRNRGQYRKEFSWEREWRKRRNYRLPERAIGIAPAAHHAALRQAALDGDRELKFIDPKWGLEEIIGRLAGFREDEVGLF